MTATCAVSNVFQASIDLFFDFGLSTAFEFSNYDSVQNQIVITSNARNKDYIGDYTYRIKTSTLNNAIFGYFYAQLFIYDSTGCKIDLSTRRNFETRFILWADSPSQRFTITLSSMEIGPTCMYKTLFYTFNNLLEASLPRFLTFYTTPTEQLL